MNAPLNRQRHIVLVNPEIHWNTGAVGRTCLGTDSTLHLIRPLGFSLDSKHLKRAGLDYWEHVKLKVWDTLDDLLAEEAIQDSEMFLFSRFSETSFWEAPWAPRSYLFFGAETSGLPESFKQRFESRQFRIPTSDKIRSLNLSTSVGIALFESLRV